MDVMGPLHGDIKFVYMLIIHDAYSGMTWARGLASKGEASQEAAWWFSEMHVAMHQKPSEIVIDHGFREIHIDQGELWSHHLPRSLCHGPECSGSRRVTGSYGRSIGIGELADTSREHGRSAVSMETMDSYRFTCKGGPGPYVRRHSHKEDQAQGAGTATKGTKLKEHADGYHSGARDKSQRNHHRSKGRSSV
ncbi:uncharacterized protein UDID_18031 [Ustilago sp. UG-2017a]|nr:uncharacterized protein UDID_18031 [Ustilago sp. UG-2017a]